MWQNNKWKLNAKKYEHYKNESLEWKGSKKITSNTSILKFFKWKTKIKGLKNINLLHEFPFYDELNIYEISKAFGWYARSYKAEIVDSKYPLTRLEARKLNIKDLFKDLLDEIKGFKYQIIVKFY